MGLIKFLIICFCIYLILKWILKPVLRILFSRMVEDFVRKHTNGQYSHESRQKRKEGNIRVDYAPSEKKNQKIPDNEGEYIDFEEVK